LPSKPNPSLFNRRTAVVNILKRRGGSTTTAPPQEEIFNEYDAFVEEDLVDETPAVVEVSENFVEFINWRLIRE
jgi:hypothetical protein